jgi:hypothetical protein
LTLKDVNIKFDHHSSNQQDMLDPDVLLHIE